MKWSTIATMLCASSVAFGGAIHQDEVLRRGDHHNTGHNAVANVKATNGQHQNVTVVVVLWVNMGGAATTTKMAESMTMPNAIVAPAATHTVVVGGKAGLVFTPDSLSAAIGDSVVFVFHSQNHTLTQSTFNQPCKKMDGGIDSGFMPNKDNNVVPPPMMAMQVTTDKPLWFYCKQKQPAGHCGKGMTFSINPTVEKSQGAFRDLAIAQNDTAEAPAAPAVNEIVSPATGNGGTGVTNGSGSGMGDNCQCSCFCGVQAFNAGAGVGAFGGMPGALPMSSMA